MSTVPLMRQADELLSLASQLGCEITGRISFGCFPILAPYVRPELLATAAEELPGLTLDTTEESLDPLTSGLQDGRHELAVGYDLGLDASLATEVLLTVAPHVVLPVGHRLARRRRIKLTALADEPMVLLDLPHSRITSPGCSKPQACDPIFDTGRTAQNLRAPSWPMGARTRPAPGTTRHRLALRSPFIGVDRTVQPARSLR
jgi:DNA-binding transcriptional LysR family regulator